MPFYTLLMASRSISAILWTLVSVNFITLVAGGLITWLGYSIPVRLKQIGLLPELVITAGFGSLIVACIGLGALNYSSHHALNIYGFLCTISALLLLLGLPEAWYKSDQFGDGSLLIDIIYFTLLFILILLLVFAFTFAHYLRCQEQIQLETQNHHHHHHHHNFQHHLANVQANQEQQQQQRRSLSGYATPNCTCELYVSDANADGNRNNHNTSILDRWIGATGTGTGTAGGPAVQQEDRHRNHNNNNNTGSSRFNIPLLGATSQQRTRSQLSELRAPSLSSNLYNSNSGGNFKEFPYSAPVNTAAAAAQRQAHRRQLQVDGTSDDDNLDDQHHHHHHHHHRHQQQQQLEPLVHKGFYHVPGDSSTIGSNVALRAQSYGRQLNELVEGDFSSNEAAALLNPQPTTNATSRTTPSAQREFPNERCSCLRPSNRSFISSSSMALNEPPTGSVDDTLVHYGRLQHQQHCLQGHHLNHFATSTGSQTGRHSVAASTLTRCRCHLKSSSPVAHKLLGLKGNQESTNIDKNYTKFTNNQSQYNTPMMNSMTGTYSARGSHKVRAKGSSSVLAVTAAAAAALFGGVGYASALANDSGCAPDSQFGNMTLGNDDHQQIDYDIRCDIDNNDHQLGVPMLNTDTSDTFQQVNATHKMFS